MKIWVLGSFLQSPVRAGVLALRLHFVDNTLAFPAAVHGYSSKPDMAVITNMLHSVDAALRVDCYYE